jgi:hypothetical protein
LVLAPHGLAAQHLSDAELLQADTGQPAAALSFQWAKHPAAIAPIVLETPRRIAALGGVSWLALLVYTLVERQVHNSLAARGETWPDRPVPSQRPTARTVFQLRRTIAVVTLDWAGRHHRQVTTLHASQLHVIDLLGDDRSIYTRPDRNSGSLRGILACRVTRVPSSGGRPGTRSWQRTLVSQQLCQEFSGQYPL